VKLTSYGQEIHTAENLVVSMGKRGTELAAGEGTEPSCKQFSTCAARWVWLWPAGSFKASCAKRAVGSTDFQKANFPNAR